MRERDRGRSPVRLLATHHPHKILPETNRVTSLEGQDFPAENSDLLTDDYKSPFFDSPSCSLRPTVGTACYLGIPSKIWLPATQRHRKRQIGVDAADLHAHLLAGLGPFDQVVLQVRGVLNVGVVHGDNDVVLLNAGGLGGFHDVFYRHAPPGAVLDCDHMNAHFGEGERFAVQGGRDDAFSQERRNGKRHATAMGSGIVAFRLYDGMHDTHDLTFAVEESPAGVAAASSDIGLNQAGINRLEECVGIAQVTERHGRPPAHGIPDSEHVLAWLHLTGSE